MQEYADLFNFIEIFFWSIIGVIFLVYAFRFPQSRLRCGIAGVAFILFGLSDAVELQTGAWWKPWWLFAWKAICVITLVGLYVEKKLKRSRDELAE